MLLWQLKELWSKTNSYFKYCWSFWEGKLNGSRKAEAPTVPQGEAPVEESREIAYKRQTHKTKGGLAAN